MYDAGKIWTGLAIFVVAVTFPFWYGFTFGESAVKPELAPPAGEQCVESKEFMKAHHMELLNEWRDAVVREGCRIYISSDNREFSMSLTNTCLGSCHGTQEAFCTRCHEYVGVRPYCWDCHNDNPGEAK